MSEDKRPAPNANSYQPGGKHYNKYGDLQPWDVIGIYGLGFLDGNAVKYLLRWRECDTPTKGGLLDLKKAQHYIAKQIEEYEKQLAARKEKGVNWDRIEGSWKQFKGKVRENWGKLTDDELDKIAGRRLQLAGKIQESYGISRDEAERQIKDWESRL